jgi:hypothetical protein
MKRRDAARLGQRAILAMTALLLSSAVAHAATYYVRSDGYDGNNGLSNTPEGAWRTFDWAAHHVSAGDVVRVQAGTYSERVTPGVSGTVGNPITFVADGVVTFCGMNVSSKNYLRIIGFTIDTDAGTCTKANRGVAVSGTNTGLEFWNNTIRDAIQVGIGSGSYADRHHNFIVIGNTFTAIGPLASGAVLLRGNHNILAYNEISNVDPDAFQIDGTQSRWLNNYIHDNPITAPYHGDAFQSNASSLGLSDNVFEANFVIGKGVVSDEHGVLLQNQTTTSCSTGTCGTVTENLFRRNVWHNLSAVAMQVDSAAVAPITNTRQVHDTIVSVMRMAASTSYGVLFRNNNTAYLYNNLNYQAWGDSASSNVKVFFADTGASIAADYNLAFTPYATPTYATPWTAQTQPRSNLNPSFVSYATGNFTLGATSAARETGGPLTTASGSGTGTTFQVATGGAGFFRGPNPSVSQYGGNLTAGDVITVGTTTRTVASVSGDAITVTSPLTWANGDPVYLGASTRPDIGAYPYRFDGHNLTATYAVANGTAIVTPSDMSLVRFVVCYEDGIPTTVINSSPYTCSVGTGSIDVRVYPLYPSKLLSIPAQRIPLAPPTNLRIIGS